MNTLLYESPFIPPEWVFAHGWMPQKRIPGANSKQTSSVETPEGLCPYARAWIDMARQEPKAQAVVLTSTCDQMRRLAELAATQLPGPVVQLHVPHTWQTPASVKYYQSELHRLGAFLISRGGCAPTDAELRFQMRRMDAFRAELRALRGRIPSGDFARAVACFHGQGSLPAGWRANHQRDNEESPRIPLVLLGGPLLREHLGLLDWIEAAGGRIVLDGTRGGEGTWPRPFDFARAQSAPFTEMTDAYFSGIPDAFRRPDSLLHSWLQHEIAERKPLGIVIHRQVWCDLWAAETQRIQEECHLPTIILESAGEALLPRRMITQVEAFLEALR